MDKEIGRIIKSVKAAGWRVKEGAHYKCYSPDGRTMVTVSKTPSARDATRKILADFRRAGLDLEKR